MAAKIITFEGVDGSGKSTLSGKIRMHYETAGLLCWQTFEPRSYIPSFDPFIVTMQLMTDRRAHCELIKHIVPTTDLILIDRFDLSTEAYQGYGDGIDRNLIQQLNELATEGIDVTRRIWLDLPVEEAVKRILARDERITAGEIERLERVLEGYVEMEEEGRLIRIDATQPPNDVLADAIKLIDEVLSQ